MELNCTFENSHPRRLKREINDKMFDDDFSVPAVDYGDIDEDDDGSDPSQVVFPMPDIHLESTDK
jgi:hypothetical protein